MLILEQMFAIGRLSDFIKELTGIIAKEAEEKADQDLFQYFLHRVFEDISFKEFKDSVIANEKARTARPAELKATVINSKNMLMNFNPVEE